MTKADTTSQDAIILIVDDNKENLQVLGNLLKTVGADISFATNGRQAIAVAGTIQPDLILLDVMMPEMDGFETCRHLKQNHKTADCPVIFLTAKTDSNSMVKGFDTGAVDYVTKPFDRKELLARVTTHIQLQRMRLALQRKNQDLEQALEEIRTLRGILPICMHCKNVRDDKGYWQQIEAYIKAHSEAEFSHGVCPACMQKFYPDLYAKNRDDDSLD